MSDFVVKVENLNVWYGKPRLFGASQRVHILHDVSFELRRGEQCRTVRSDQSLSL